MLINFQLQLQVGTLLSMAFKHVSNFLTERKWFKSMNLKLIIVESYSRCCGNITLGSNPVKALPKTTYATTI